MNTSKIISVLVSNTLNKLHTPVNERNITVVKELVNNLKYIEDINKLYNYGITNNIGLHTKTIIRIVKNFKIHGSDDTLTYLKDTTIFKDTTCIDILKVLNNNTL